MEGLLELHDRLSTLSPEELHLIALWASKVHHEARRLTQAERCAGTYWRPQQVETKKKKRGRPVKFTSCEAVGALEKGPEPGRDICHACANKYRADRAAGLI